MRDIQEAARQRFFALIRSQSKWCARPQPIRGGMCMLLYNTNLGRSIYFPAVMGPSVRGFPTDDENVRTIQPGVHPLL
jgi:hypothetical protein